VLPCDVLLCDPLPQAAHTTAVLTSTAHTPRAPMIRISIKRPAERPQVYAAARPTAMPPATA
jgi:hypothetical protein